jgi:hypothetical protein
MFTMTLIVVGVYLVATLLATVVLWCACFLSTRQSATHQRKSYQAPTISRPSRCHTQPLNHRVRMRTPAVARS